MESSTTLKRKRVAKNRKKAWRKYSNIADVEDFLQSQREQQRTGGLASEKTNDALFFEDRNESKKKKKASKQASVRRRRGPIKHKIDRQIQPDPRIPPVPKALPRKVKRTSKRILEIQAKERQGIIKPSERRKRQAASRQRTVYAKNQEAKKLQQDDGRATFDIWGRDALKVTNKSGIEADDHYLRVTKKKTIKLPPKYHAKPSKLPVVEIVAPGASYNPSLEDHQNLVYSTYETELKKQKEENKILRWHKIPKLTASEAQATYISEMSAGLFPEDGEVDGEPKIAEGDRDVLPNPPTTYENRKTKKKRRVEREHKEKAKQLKFKKILKIQQNEVFRLRSIAKEIAAEKLRQEEEKGKRVERLKQMELVPRAVGRFKLEEEPMVVRLSDELVGTLRELKPEGHILRDRYKSLQSRNIIETRSWARGRKAQYKVYEKKSYKEIPV